MVTDEWLKKAEVGDRECWENESGQNQELENRSGRVGNLLIRLCVLARPVLRHA